MGLSCGLVMTQKACASHATHVASELSLIARASAPWRHAPLWESGGHGQIAVLELPEWHVVFGDVRPFLEEGLSSRLSSLSKGGRVFCIIAESASGGLGFELHEHGCQVRRWLEVEGVVDANEGSPLPEEPIGLFTSEPDENDDRDFWKAISIAECITGTRWDSFHLMQAEVHRTSV